MGVDDSLWVYVFGWVVVGVIGELVGDCAEEDGGVVGVCGEGIFIAVVRWRIGGGGPVNGIVRETGQWAL